MPTVYEPIRVKTGDRFTGVYTVDWPSFCKLRIGYEDRGVFIVDPGVSDVRWSNLTLRLSVPADAPRPVEADPATPGGPDYGHLFWLNGIYAKKGASRLTLNDVVIEGMPMYALEARGVRSLAWNNGGARRCYGGVYGGSEPNVACAFSGLTISDLRGDSSRSPLGRSLLYPGSYIGQDGITGVFADSSFRRLHIHGEAFASIKLVSGHGNIVEDCRLTNLMLQGSTDAAGSSEWMSATVVRRNLILTRRGGLPQQLDPIAVQCSWPGTAELADNTILCPERGRLSQGGVEREWLYEAVQVTGGFSATLTGNRFLVRDFDNARRPAAKLVNVAVGDGSKVNDWQGVNETVYAPPVLVQ